MLQIQNLSKAFGKNQVLNDISMTINNGEFISILGPSGCGKTTLLKIIAGLEIQDSGKVLIHNKCQNKIPARKRGAVIVFQDYGLFPHMTVKQNIEFGLLAQKIKPEIRMREITNILQLMQIGDKANHYPRELSGGQKQRVALARACVLKPNVLLLDEPFSSLDAALKKVTQEFIAKLHKELAITTILVTHDKEEAFSLSDKVAVFLAGHLQQFDKPANIYNQPKTSEVADFIGDANYLQGVVRDSVFACELGNFPAIKVRDGAAKLRLRYDQVRINQSKELPALIVDKQYKGQFTTYTIAVQTKEYFKMQVSSHISDFEVGKQVFIDVEPKNICIFPN